MDLFKDLLYPGTFNPIHNAHLDIAEKARIETGAEKVILIPAFSPYHKENGSNATAKDRFEMTKLAANSRKNFEISDIEYRMAKDKSYTVEAIKQLIEEELNTPYTDNINLPCKIKLLIGADSLENIESWYKADELSKLVEFVVVTRPNCFDISETEKKITLPHFSFKNIEAYIDISSEQIREFIKRGIDASEITPKPVLKYILQNRLYQ